MKKTDIAYYAGIFDGEGCVIICKTKAKTSRTHLRYCLQCRVSNTNKWLIHSLQKIFGGAIFSRNRRDTIRKQCWDWSIASKQAAFFLRIIYPYLHVKKDEARVALEFQSHRVHGGRGLAQTDEEWDLQERQKILLQTLKRGSGNQHLPNLMEE